MSKHYLQEKITGTQGQVVGFDASGNAVAQAAPQTGYSKTETLQDATKVLFGLTSAAVPDDVFNILADSVTHIDTHIPDKIVGKDWEGKTLESAMNYACFGGGKFVLVGNSNAYYSIDGKTWTLTSMPANRNWLKPCYGNGKFVTVADGSNYAAYSLDGITWTQVSLPTSGGWTRPAYGGGKFVVMTTNQPNSCVSSDGITWTNVSTNSAHFSDVVYGGNLFIAPSNASNTKDIYVSTNGTSWTKKSTLDQYNNWGSIAYGNGVFVLSHIGDVRDFSYSTNGGDTWLTASIGISGSHTIRSIDYGNGAFVAVAYNWGSALYSTDGITWVQVSLPSSAYWYSVCSGNEMFLTLAFNTTTYAISQNTFKKTSALADVKGNALNVPSTKIETGSYVGTGTYGSGNRTSISFSFLPKLAMIYRWVQTTGNSKFVNATFSPLVVQSGGNINYSVNIAGAQQEEQAVTWSGNSVSWYHASSAMYQLNDTGTTYYWIAIG